jgi:hypothetical protein
MQGKTANVVLSQAKQVRLKASLNSLFPSLFAHYEITVSNQYGFHQLP